MNTRVWWTRMVVGASLGVALGSAPGCLRDDDDFVEKYAAEICKIVRDCNTDLYLPGADDPLSIGNCEAQVESRYLECGSRCEYQPQHARRCLRRLRRDECNYEYENVDSIPIVCSQVFSGCEVDAVGGDEPTELQMDESDRQCNAPVRACSVSGQSNGQAGVLALGLLALGFVARRRRRA